MITNLKNLNPIFSDDLLSLAEFTLICRALFRNDKGHIYVLPEEQLKQMFIVFDKNQDGYIDRDEFQFCWNYWIKTVKYCILINDNKKNNFKKNSIVSQIVRPVNAFLVIDVQNDFISGSLNISHCSAQHDGHEVWHTHTHTQTITKTLNHFLLQSISR